MQLSVSRVGQCVKKICYYMCMKKITQFALATLVAVIVISIYQVYGWFKGPQSRISLDQASVVTEIRSLSKLETTSFTMEKIIEGGVQGNAFQNILYGDRILLIAHAEIIAGFDMSKLEVDDVRVSGTTVELRLPAPEILVSRLDNEKTRVYDRKLGIFTKGDPQLESEARLAAENSIRQAACDAGILMVAQQNGAQQLRVLLELAGFEKVNTVFAKGECK